MAAGSIVIDLLMRTGSFVTDTDRATKAFSKMQRQVAADAKALQASIEGVASKVRGAFSALTSFGPLATIFAGGSLVAGIHNLVGGIDDLDEAAQNLGTTAVALSDLQAASKQAGVGAEELQGSLGRLSAKAVDAATGGKEAAATFKAMGIEVKDANGHVKAADVLLAEVADKFAAYEDGAQKTALAIDLFGKAGARMIAYLNQGGAALKANSGLTEETVKQAVELQRSFDALALSSQQFANRLAAAVIPSLNAFFQALNTGAGIINAVRASLTLEAGGFEGVRKELDATTEELKRLREAAQPIDLFGQGGILGDASKEIEALEKKQKALAAILFPNVQGGASSTGRGQAPSTGRGQAPRVPKPTTGAKEIDEAARAYQQYVKQLDSALRATEDLSEEEKVLRVIREGQFGQDFTAQQRELLLMVASEIDGRRELAAMAKLEADAKKDIAAANKALMDEGARIFEETRTPAEKLNNELDRMKVLLDAGAISWQTYQRKVADLNEEFDKTMESSKKASTELDDAARELGLTFSSAFEDAIVAGKNLRDVLHGLLDDILRIVTRKLITEPFADAISGALGSGGGLGSLAGLFGMGGGGIGPTLPDGMPVFATGTDYVPKTGPAIIHKGERIIPAAENASGNWRGGGMVQNIAFSVSGPITRATQRQLSAAMWQAGAAAKARNG